MKQTFLSGILIVITTLGLIRCNGEPRARFIRQVDWVGQGVWLKADLHLHTTFSDGSHTVAEVVAKAAEFGCDVVAITDHTYRNLKAATPAYFQTIARVRKEYPEMIILAGVEWNVPPWGRRVHVNVLVQPTPKESMILLGLKQFFDGDKPENHDPALAAEGLRWLAKTATVDGVPPVVIYNHPSRKTPNSLEAVANLERWQAVNDLTIGFEGSPGHQGDYPSGHPRYIEQLIDRWDPAAARIGDAWDTLLGKGIDIWAAFAFSDFHNERADRWPGEFSETWIYVPERSPAGVLQALRAGTFFAAHGHIVRAVDFSVEAPRLPRPASVGEVIEVPPSTQVTARVRFIVPARDWAGQPNRIDAIELVAITTNAVKVLAHRPPKSQGAALVETVTVPAEGLVLRVRGRRVVSDGPDLMFYTNPIRITVKGAAKSTPT